jgi:hypothetical protein
MFTTLKQRRSAHIRRHELDLGVVPMAGPGGVKVLLYVGARADFHKEKAPSSLGHLKQTVRK